MRIQDESRRIAEDDRLRSLYMRDLIQAEHSLDVQFGNVTIPKVLIQFWHDLAALPADVQECLESWAPLTACGFKRLLFDDSKARAFIRRHFGDSYVTAFDRCRHPAMRCDYFRLCYICTNGGFYVDADEVYHGGDCEFLYRDNRLKVQPLCYDTRTDAMVCCDVFIAQKACSPDWIFYVNNNPIVAPAFHPIIRSALARSTRILLSQAGERLDIQATTGPGNLTASLVQYSIASRALAKHRDFLLLRDWKAISTSRWPLSYRDDERNWRLWSPAS